MRIGCLFGSFDPPHLGHLAIAEHMLRKQGLDKVWLIVTPMNPFKIDRRLSSEEQRLDMTRLAVAGRDGVSASELEFALPRPSYTVDTLAWMRAHWPEHSFVLIIGSDNLAGLHRWKRPEAILAAHHVLVYPRPGQEAHMVEAVLKDHPNIRIVTDAPVLEISSTGIRKAVQEERPISGSVPIAVETYISEHGLYKS